MFTKIELEDGTIHYNNSIVKLREFVLEYINPVNNIKSEYTLFILFDSNTYLQDKFVVKDFLGLNRAFDTYNDANSFAYHVLLENYNKIREESKEIEIYVAKHSKKRKKNGR